MPQPGATCGIAGRSSNSEARSGASHKGTGRPTFHPDCGRVVVHELSWRQELLRIANAGPVLCAL
jgi:hypothetical protein